MEKRTTIYDIAQHLGISTATVNRALTGKPRIKEETRQLVLQTAQEMGFKPNTIARSLSRRQLRLAVLAFSNFPEFHREFVRGGEESMRELADFNVAVDFYIYDGDDVNSEEAGQYLTSTLNKIAEDAYDGALLLCRDEPAIKRLQDKGVYVATAVNNISSHLRKFHICYDTRVAGRMAAELLYHWMPSPDLPVAIASGQDDLGVHNRIVAGFREQMQYTPLNLCCVHYNRDDEQIAYDNTMELLTQQPDLGGIYVNSFNYRGVVRAVQDAGRAGKLVIITSDISQELRQLIRQGVVSASLFQNQYEQGKQGLRRIYEALTDSQRVADTIALMPQLILSSNLDLF